MRRTSELDEWIRSHLAGGVRESSGHFTLSPEKSLELMAKFQLPRRSQWILKVIQGIVASGASHIEIRQTRVDTQVLWQGGELGSSPEQFGEALLRPLVDSNRSLEALKRALWTAALGPQRPFRLVLEGADEWLLWTGDELERLPGSTPDQSRLIVSHHTIEQLRADGLRPELLAAEENADLLKELAESAFTCPIPLTVDGRRMDGLQEAPFHGNGYHSNAFFLGAADVASPRWTLPAGTFVESRKTFLGLPASPIPLQHMGPLAEAPLAVMLSLHLRRVSEGRGMKLRTGLESCRLFWISDGCVVHREELELEPNCVSCALFASAEDLELDLSGFCVRDTPAYRERRELLLQTVPEAWLEASLDLRAWREGHRKQVRFVGAAIGVGGLLTFTPILAAAGALLFALSGEMDEAEIEQELQAGLEQLKTRWASGPGTTDSCPAASHGLTLGQSGLLREAGSASRTEG